MGYSIKAYLRLDKKDKVTSICPIELVVTLRNKLTKFTLSKHFAAEDIWDRKNGLINISAVLKSKELRKSKSYYEGLNEAILQKKSDFKLFMLEQERLRVDVTIEKVRSFFKAGTQISFFEFWDEQFALMQPKLKPSTILSYQDTKKILMKFKPRLDFGDITNDLIKKFDNYLIVERGNSAGGRFNRHKNFKSILKLALMNKYIKDNPYHYFKIETAKGNRSFLTIDELRNLSLFSLPQEHRNLKEVFDMFLFACYTGLRYSDIQNLKWKNIFLEEERIEIEMIKTSNDLKLTLFPSALEIIKGLNRFHHPDSFVFKRITNQAMNRSLKLIIKEASIKKTITFHCARHTFATVLIEIGTPIYNVKGLLGHQNVENTQIYAKLLQKELNTSMTHFGNMLVAS